MTKDNAVFTEMKKLGYAWEERRAERNARKQEIIDTYGWDSKELSAWYAEKDADMFPFTAGQNKAYYAWAESLGRSEDELEMSEFLFDNEVHDFIETLRKAGIHSFIYTNNGSAVMDNIHAFAAEGFKMIGLCNATRCENRWGEIKPYDVPGIRFEDAK